MQRTSILALASLLLIFAAAFLNAQSTADRDLIERVRALYYSPVSRPAYMACDAQIDWDDVARQAKLPKAEGYRLGLELAKAMQISFITRGSKHTDVHVIADTRIAEQQQRAQQLVTYFFARYWDTADGRFLPRASDDYQLVTSPDGYVITRQVDGVVASVQVNALLLITKAAAHNSRTGEDLEITPTFAKENDGLLHLHGLSATSTLGELHRALAYQFDYQLVGGFYIPHHVTMSMPGVVSYPYTFSNCQAFDKNNAPARERPVQH